MALGVYGFGFEDAMTHLFNLVWPNMFEVSPHMVQAFTDAVDGMRVSVGPGKVLSYLLQVRILVGLCQAQFWLMLPPPPLQGLFHPARKVRDAYWRIYNNLYIGAQVGDAHTHTHASARLYPCAPWFCPTCRMRWWRPTPGCPTTKGTRTLDTSWTISCEQLIHYLRFFLS